MCVTTGVLSKLLNTESRKQHRAITGDPGIFDVKDLAKFQRVTCNGDAKYRGRVC